MTNDEEYESDSSVETTDYNETIKDEDVYEKEVKGIDRTTTKKIKVQKKPASKTKTKPIPIPKKPKKKVITSDMTEEVQEESINEIVEEETEPEPPKKSISDKRLENLKKAREAKAQKCSITKNAIKKIKKEVKKEIPEKIIQREKIIYMIPTSSGFVECDTLPKLTKNELKKMENEELVSKEEIEIGKKILRKQNGTADLRSANTKKRGQTEAQKEATKKMLEANRKRREAKKKEKEETLGKQVKSALIDVVSKPLEESKKEIEKPKEEPKKNNQYDFSTITRFF